MASENMIKVVQGTHSFQVSESNVNRHPNSFLALCLTFPSTQRDSSGAIIVEDRNTEYFCFVEKVYLGGKIKLPNSVKDKSSVEEELSFWFPGEIFEISYKDPLTEIYQELKVKQIQLRESEKKRIKELILSAAARGEKQISVLLHESICKREWEATYMQPIYELFPGELNIISNEFPSVSIWWSIGTGTLSAITEKFLKQKSKMVLAELKKQTKGSWISDIYVPLHPIFNNESIPPHFIEYFNSYLKRKSEHPFVYFIVFSPWRMKFQFQYHQCH